MDLTTFFIVSDNLMVLCICMAIGFVCRKINIITDEVNRGLSGLLLNAAVPCTIIMSMQKPFTTELLAEGFLLSGVMAVVFLSGAAIGLLCCRVLKIPESDRGVWLFALALSNIVYMGFPVIYSVFGEGAMFYASFATLPFHVIAFSIGIKWLAGKSAPVNLKSIFVNAAMVSTGLGLLLFLFAIKLPGPIGNSFTMVGSMTTPVSMIIIGGLLAKGDIRSTFADWRLYVLAFIRLVIIPMAVLFILKPWIKNEMLAAVIVMASAMPSATVTAILAEQYGGNSTLASKVVLISTLMCILTIPAISLLL